jgi:hypothetical protein
MDHSRSLLALLEGLISLPLGNDNHNRLSDCFKPINKKKLLNIDNKCYLQFSILDVMQKMIGSNQDITHELDFDVEIDC